MDNNFRLNNQEKSTPKESLENTQIMENLENQIPGAVKLLTEKYGIQEFHRYPLEVLLSQVKEEDEQLPYGLVVFPKSDFNGAFNELKPALTDLYKQTRGHYAMKIAESGSKFDLARKFITLDQKYGAENKIGFLILSGHGIESGEGLALGEYDQEIPRGANSANGAVIWKDETGSSSFKRVNQNYLDKDAEIVFLSCSTGRGGGLAETVATSLERKTMAPSIFVQLHNLKIRASYDEKNKIHIKTVFQDEEALSMMYDHRAPTDPNEENKQHIENPEDYF